jgi:hypothetical protein
MYKGVLAMNTERDYTIHSFAEYIEVLKKIQSLEKTELWYRGQRLSTRHLDPTLYRGNLCYETDDGHGFTIEPMPKTFKFKGQTVRFPDQYKMLSEFKKEIARKKLIPSDNMNEIEWLCFAQHCGMPTSLLDWSEDPIVGLHFAICNIKVPIKDEEKKEEAIVFVLNPSISNSNCTIWGKDKQEDGKYATYSSTPNKDAEENDQGITYPIPITDTNYESFVDYSISHLSTPVCIKPRKLGYRMCRQSGDFLLYSANIQPLDMYPENAINQFLYRIHIPYTNVQELMEDLKALNVTKESIYGDYPDLDAAGKKAKKIGKEQIDEIVKEIIEKYKNIKE